MACGVQKNLVYQDIPVLPSHFGVYKKDSKRCPVISGTFYKKAEILSGTSSLSHEDSTEYDFMDYFQLGSMRAELEFYDNAGVDLIDSGKFRVTMESSNIIYVESKHLTKNMITRKKIDPTEYECKDGFVYLKEIKSIGGGDGTSGFFKSFIRIGLLGDGNLIIYKQITFPRAPAKHYFVKFTRVSPSES